MFFIYIYVVFPTFEEKSIQYLRIFQWVFPRVFLSSPPFSRVFNFFPNFPLNFSIPFPFSEVFNIFSSIQKFFIEFFFVFQNFPQSYCIISCYIRESIIIKRPSTYVIYFDSHQMGFLMERSEYIPVFRRERTRDK